MIGFPQNQSAAAWAAAERVASVGVASVGAAGSSGCVASWPASVAAARNRMVRIASRFMVLLIISIGELPAQAEALVAYQQLVPALLVHGPLDETEGGIQLNTDLRVYA